MTYIDFVSQSITGVLVMPTSGVIEPHRRCLATRSVVAWNGRASGGSSDTWHSGAGAAPVASASNAYTLSCSVAAITTSCGEPFIVRPGTYSGCAYTLPST